MHCKVHGPADFEGPCPYCARHRQIEACARAAHEHAWAT
jgi:hypothetical protein